MSDAERRAEVRCRHALAQNRGMSALIVFCAVPPAAADRLARLLVEERLAACVQALPGLCSTYRWEGMIEQADETLLLIKTTVERYPALERTLAARHAYDLPEVLAVDAAAGLPAYLRWLADETTTGEPGDSD